MKKTLVIALMLVAGIAQAQTPPKGWFNVPGTDVFRDWTATVHSYNGHNTRAEVWGWTRELGYIKITVGCSYDSYRIEKDGKSIVDRPYDPGHQFWSIKQSFCY
jgi:hypothetical protein